MLQNPVASFLADDLPPVVLKPLQHVANLHRDADDLLSRKRLNASSPSIGLTRALFKSSYRRSIVSRNEAGSSKYAAGASSTRSSGGATCGAGKIAELPRQLGADVDFHALNCTAFGGAVRNFATRRTRPWCDGQDAHYASVFAGCGVSVSLRASTTIRGFHARSFPVGDAAAFATGNRASGLPRLPRLTSSHPRVLPSSIDFAVSVRQSFFSIARDFGTTSTCGRSSQSDRRLRARPRFVEQMVVPVFSDLMKGKRICGESVAVGRSRSSEPAITLHWLRHGERATPL